MNSYQRLKEKKQLGRLVDAWRFRQIGEAESGDPEDCQAKELDTLIRNAVCRLDFKFFHDLSDVLRDQALTLEKLKSKIDPSKLKKVDLRQWFRESAQKPRNGSPRTAPKPKERPNQPDAKERTDPFDAIRNARASFVNDYTPTWSDVLEIARYSYNLPNLSKTSEKRLRRAAGMQNLPNRPSGRRRKN
jgi:hypothetical protein